MERSPLRIGIYSNQYPGISGAGGIATYTHSLATALAAAGHAVHVLVAGASLAPHQRDGVGIHCIEPGYLPLLEPAFPGVRAAWQISATARQLVREHNLDIFEFPNWEGGGCFFKTGRQRVPMVVRLHTSAKEIFGMENVRIGLPQRISCAIEKMACLRADSLYVSTRAHREHMARELGIAADRIGVVPLGVPDISDPAMKQPRARNADPVLLFLGRLEARKGVTDLLNAIPEIAARVPNVKLVLIGKDRAHAPDGMTHEEFFARHFPAELQKHVLFTGFLSDADAGAWLRKADAFVAPSIYESFGLIFIEAMRYALPVIGSTAGGIPEVVSDGVNGFLVEPRQPGQIATAAIKLLTDEPLRRRMASAARETYEARFSNRVMAERTIAYYRTILEKHAPQGAGLKPAAAE